MKYTSLLLLLAAAVSLPATLAAPVDPKAPSATPANASTAGPATTPAGGKAAPNAGAGTTVPKSGTAAPPAGGAAAPAAGTGTPAGGAPAAPAVNSVAPPATGGSTAPASGTAARSTSGTSASASGGTAAPTVAPGTTPAGAAAPAAPATGGTVAPAAPATGATAAPATGATPAPAAGAAPVVLGRINEKLLPDADATYLVMIDAGSSGSRARVFRFGKKNGKQVVVPLFVDNQQWDYKTKAGPIHGVVKLGSEPKPTLAPAEVEKLKAYLQELLDKAKAVIPANKVAGAYISLMATAGMRQLKSTHRRVIMQSVRHILRQGPFKKTIGRRLAYVLPGEDEGVFTWMTYNHLKGTLTSDDDKALDAWHRTLTDESKQYDYKSTGIIEVGGASTQVVFVPRSEPLANSYHLHVDKSDITLYATSYMGFGNDQAIQKLLHGQATSRCAVKGTVMKRSKPGADGKLVLEDVPAAATYNDTACDAAIAKDVLDLDAPCTQPRCAFAGRYMPKFPRDMKVAVVSTFVNVQKALNCGSGRKNDQSVHPNTLECIDTRIKKVCAADGKDAMVALIKTEFGNAGYSWNEQFSPNLCFQGKLAVSMMHKGFHIAMDRQLTFVSSKSLTKLMKAGQTEPAPLTQSTSMIARHNANIGWEYGAALSFVKMLGRLGETLE